MAEAGKNAMEGGRAVVASKAVGRIVPGSPEARDEVGEPIK
jgi:hypothetical protein